MKIKRCINVEHEYWFSLNISLKELKGLLDYLIFLNDQTDVYKDFIRYVKRQIRVETDICYNHPISSVELKIINSYLEIIGEPILYDEKES